MRRAIHLAINMTTLLVVLYSTPLKEGHVTLLIHDQYSLVVIFHAFQAEFLGGEDRAGIIGIARPMHAL